MGESPGESSTLSERIGAVRMDLFGECGGPVLARRVGIPQRLLARMEAGSPFPGLLVLKLIEVTGVNSQWLLSAEGERFGQPTLCPLDGRRSSMRSAE
jgi:hypothetical protein